MVSTEITLPGQDEQSINLEQSILGSLLIYPDRLIEIEESFKPAFFYRNAHKLIFQVICDLDEANTEIDCFTVCDELEKRGQLQDVGEMHYVLSLTNEVLLSFNIHADAQIIANKALQRDLIFAGSKVTAIGQAGGDAASMLNAATQCITNLERVSNSGLKPISEIMDACREEISQAYELRHSIIGVPTGFREFDKLLGGLQPTDLILLAARPSMGKTSLGMNIGYNAAVVGKQVAIFSLEMGERQLGHRLISLVSSVPAERIRKGWIREEEWDGIVAAEDLISELPISINDTSGSPVLAIKNSVLRRQAEIGKPIDLIIIDYLQLMKQDSETEKQYRNRVQEIGNVSRGLKALAKELNVPVLALAQLSRAVEGRTSKRPQLSDLRDSGELEQDADIVVFIYRDDYYNRPDPITHEPTSDRPGIADIIIDKNRNGQTGDFRLRFEVAQTRFADLPQVVTWEQPQ